MVSLISVSGFLTTPFIPVPQFTLHTLASSLGTHLNLADINECAEAAANNGTDDARKMTKLICGNGGKRCINMPGSFRCECPPGYLTDDKGHCTGKVYYSTNLSMVYNHI